jgi:hypothetical protein
MRFTIFSFLFLFFFTQSAFANPYWDPRKVPTDSQYSSSHFTIANVRNLKKINNNDGIDVLRVQINWQADDESYHIGKTIVEPSGTPALLSRSQQKTEMGSYVGLLRDNQTGQAVFYDSVGTGKEYRKLARAINLRFPVPEKDMTFELYAENPTTGMMEKVTSQIISIAQLTKQKQLTEEVDIRELSLSSKIPALRVNIYAEGYSKNDKDLFWQHAMKAVQALQREKFPGVEYMSFYGVFHSSNKTLGEPLDLGTPVPEYDTFLGLYYPYWDKFGRWYDVVYPTREDKLRTGFASAPYDYPIVLTNSNGYWGIGNYMSFTAIPAANSYYFTYLLLHEFGHFFGLNEEYNGGGRTELEFAPEMAEPWSQNITFLTDTHYNKLKWKSFVDSSIPLPTPDSVWQSSPPVYGAYVGGYADSTSTKGRSHIPGLNCAMEAQRHFCAICTDAIERAVQFSLGAH